MKEKIICIVTPDSRSYYRAVLLAKEFLDKDHNIINISGTLPDGEVEELTVTTKTVKHYKNSKLDGLLEMIDLSTGEVTLAEQYKEGVLIDLSERTLHGTPLPIIPRTVSDYTGTVMKVNKTTQSFYVGGQEVAEQTVAANGASLELLGDIPDGPVKEFDENGQTRCEAHYKDNQLEGELLRYDERGRLLSREEYHHGQIHGSAQYYTHMIHGTAKTEAQYQNSQLHGEWKSFFPNGVVSCTALYQNGKLQGPRTAFYTNGKKNCEENFENGKLQGYRRVYFPQGELWYQENYKNGRLDGERFSFFQNGKKRLAEFYTDGLLEGARHIYDKNGQILTQEEYHWGTLVHNTERKKVS